METPVEGERNLYLLRSGAEKRYLKLLLTKRDNEELGFVEDVTRRIVQLNAGQQEYDDVTGMLRMSAFSNVINQKIQENENFILDSGLYFGTGQNDGLFRLCQYKLLHGIHCGSTGKICQ